MYNSLYTANYGFWRIYKSNHRLQMSEMINNNCAVHYFKCLWGSNLNQ